MNILNEMELQNIRHIANASCGFKEKLNYYTTITNDTTALNQMEQIIATCDNLKNDLLSKLN